MIDMDRQRSLPLLGQLLIIVALLISALADPSISIKYPCCFARSYNLIWVLALMAVCFVINRSLIRDVFAKTRLFKLWILLPGLALLSAVIGGSRFELTLFYHGLMGISTLAWLPIIKRNFWSVAIPVVAVLLLCAPWRDVRKSRVLAWVEVSAAVVLLNYNVAFMAYVVFRSYGEQ